MSLDRSSKREFRHREQPQTKNGGPDQSRRSIATPKKLRGPAGARRLWFRLGEIPHVGERIGSVRLELRVNVPHFRRVHHLAVNAFIGGACRGKWSGVGLPLAARECLAVVAYSGLFRACHPDTP